METLPVKLCGACETPKTIDLFYKSKYGLYKRESYCKTCHSEKGKQWAARNKEKVFVRQKELRQANPEREYYYRQKYLHGITKEQYAQLCTEQNNVCAICKQPPENVQINKRLDLDHDHKTNKVRGLLCRGCNIVLGKFNDDVSLLEACIKYLEENR